MPRKYKTREGTPEEREKWKEKSRLARIRKKEWYAEIMRDRSCGRCGERDIAVLQWHHTDPSKKEMTVSDMIQRRGIPTILDEMAKCVCLCANCHLRVHDEQRKSSS